MWKEWVMKEISQKSRIGLSGSKRVSSHPSETRRPAEAQAERSGEGSVTLLLGFSILLAKVGVCLPK